MAKKLIFRYVNGTLRPMWVDEEYETEKSTNKYMNEMLRNKGKVKDELKEKVNEETKKVEERASNELKKFKKEEIDVKKVAERGGLTEEEAKECVKVAEDVYREAEKNEPEISKDLINSVEQVNGKMYGLDFRMKQPTSLAGKIGDDAKQGGISFEMAGKDIKDAVRYTMILDEDNFVNSYNKIKNGLEAKGYKEVRLKNFYQMYQDGEAQQKAIQCVYQNSNGYVFELQFHTNNSQGAKELNHPLYEEWRNASTSQKRKEELERKMINIGKNVRNPKNIMSIKSHK